MTHDRTYWRAQDDKRLIDEAKHNPSAELAIALGERLEDSPDPNELDELHDELREAQRKIATLEADLEALERDFEALQDAAG